MSFERHTWDASQSPPHANRVPPSQHVCRCPRPLVEVPEVPVAGRVDCRRCKGWTTLSRLTKGPYA